MIRPLRIWILFGVMMALSVRIAMEQFWIASLVPPFLWAGAGLVGAVVTVWRMRNAECRPGGWRTLAAMGATAVAFVPLTYLGGWLTEEVRFRASRRSYVDIVDAVTAEPVSRRLDYGERGGVRYVADAGPPVRVAFPWPGGVTDNWCGVVYDPDGAVQGINDVARFSAAWEAHPMKGLFGGALLSCRTKDPPFYFCCFT